MLHQHWGFDNTFSNNIFAFGGEGNEDGGIRTDPGSQVSLRGGGNGKKREQLIFL